MNYRICVIALLATVISAFVSLVCTAEQKDLASAALFMESGYGMRIQKVREANDRIFVQSSGAEFCVDRRSASVGLVQKIGTRRKLVTAKFDGASLKGLRVAKKGTGAVIISSADSAVSLKMQGDSVMLIKTRKPIDVTFNLSFKPAWSADDYSANYLLLDPKGGIGIFTIGEPLKRVDQIADRGMVRLSLKAGQEVMVTVCPPRPFDWEKSFQTRIIAHYVADPALVYPSDEQIKTWAREKYGNVIFLASDALLWKNWWLGFESSNPDELRRVIATAHANGMKVMIYTSPGFLVKGTPKEQEARTNTPKPGDTYIYNPTGSNADYFLAELKKVYETYHPDGFYFDGIYMKSMANSYYVVRKTRELIGDDGILMVHLSEGPPREFSYLRCPAIDTYADFMLRGEREYGMYQDEEYLRYHLSTYNISNSIGILLQSELFAVPPADLVDRVLRNNLRLYFCASPAPIEPQAEALRKYYWPRLNESLKAEVAKAETENKRPEPYVGQIPPSSQDMLRDDFTNGPGNWQILSDKWAIAADGFTSLGSAKPALAVAGRDDWTDYTLQVRTRVTGSSDYNVTWLKSFILARVQDQGNFYRFGIHGDIWCLNLLKCVNGQWTELARWHGFRPMPGRWYTLKLSVVGDRITGYLDGKPVVDARDNTFKSGRVGLYTDNRILTTFTDIVVRKEQINE
ncbi:MAG: family 16 glycoside hydrolase [Armatimonadota bacterium]